MADQTLPYALTTLARIKTLLTIDNANFDLMLTNEINSVTEFLNQECNRNFLMQKYISEVHSQWGVRQKYVILKRAPVFYITDIVSTTGGQNTITLNNANGVKVGMPIFGDFIASGTTITVLTGNVATLSLPASGTSSSAHIIICGLLNLQYRAGTPDNPSWTNFIPTQFELVDDGKAGIVRVYGFISSIYNNTIKADYWAGYLINWQKAGDNLTHTLPMDITRTCENLVIRAYKRREQAGKTSQSLEGSTITYDRMLDSIDQQVIARYRRVPTIC
jgi:hypothetical protein